MKLFFKKNIPKFVWETARGMYVYARRLLSDILQTGSLDYPADWARVFLLVRAVRPGYTMVRPSRLRLLYQISQKVNMENITGDIVECGVYNGGSAAMMATPQVLSVSRNVWLFDSFEGLPLPTENDGKFERDNYYKGWCKGSIGKVEEIFHKINFPRERLYVIKGWFEDTIPKEAQKIRQIAVLHIDADWYESVKICLETFYPKISKGGYVVIDDYYKWEGCKKAIDEYLSRNNIQVELKTKDVAGYYFKKS